MPVTTEAKLMRQMLAVKERGFIQVLCYLGEWQTPISKLILLHKPRQKAGSRVSVPF